MLRAVNERTRLVALCNPNDPTGELVSAADLAALLEALPERVVVLLDEALRDFVDAEPRDAALALLADHPRLLVFRTFSKAWGLAGLRCGYAVGGPGAEPLLAQLEPELGVNELAQAGALEALRHRAAGRRRPGGGRRARAGAARRGRRRGRTPTSPSSQANVLWLAADGIDGAELARRLERAGLDRRTRRRARRPRAHPRHRAARHAEAADRALRALESAVAPRDAAGRGIAPDRADG